MRDFRELYKIEATRWNRLLEFIKELNVERNKECEALLRPSHIEIPKPKKPKVSPTRYIETDYRGYGYATPGDDEPEEPYWEGDDPPV